MDLSIRHNGFDMTEAIDGHVRDRVHAALDQHDSHVKSVAVTLLDENGPRGGVDKSCKIQVALVTQADPVIVKKPHEDLYLAVTDAADTVKRHVGRLVRKARDKR